MTLMARLRRFWLDVHLWLGAGLAIAIIPLCLSGAVLVFHDDLERYLEPQRFAVSEGPALPASQLIDAGRDALPDGFVATQLRLPEHAGEPATVSGRARGRPQEGRRPETRTVFLDPASGRVLDVANTRAGFFGVMHVLHGSLMIPEVGRKVVGWIGWAMTISSLTGIWLWWPRNNNLLAALRWRRSPSTNFNLHHMLGFWIAIPLFILSVTGVYISFPQTARQWTAAVMPMSAQRGPGGPGGPGGGGQPLQQAQTSADEAVAAALGILPGELASVSLPTRARGDEGPPPSWRVGVRVEGRTDPVNVSVADATGQAEQPELREPLAGDGVPRLMRRIHDGIDQHIVWRWIVFAGGVIPAILAVTGIVMWLRRRARRRAIKRGHAATT
ncbi:MAG: PepSY-associated TM helix domain-containing protein [Hyphomonadaceae bacterium]